MLQANTKTIAKLFNTNCKSVDFNGVSIDSRDCKNQLFIAIIGTRFDGHNFISDAIKGGAKAVVVSKNISVAIPSILVQDTTEALGLIARFYRQNICLKSKDLKIIAITGSNGKTTTKNMLFNIFSQVAPTLKTIGNFNNHIGVPLTLLRLKPEHKFAIIEMGANHLGEIKSLRKLTTPDVACVINTLDAHIGEFGGKDNLVKAKSEIYSPTSFNIVNTSINLDSNLKIDYSFGTGGSVDFSYLKNIKLQLLGAHNLENALAAAAVAKSLGVSDKIIKIGLEQTTAEKNRLEKLSVKNNNTIISDCYNASPKSTEYGLKTLAEFSGVKIAILGKMAELGDKSYEIHAKIGKYAKTLNIDYLYSIGDSQDVGNYNFKNFKNLEQLADKINTFSGATILLKASRGVALENLIDKLR